MSTLKKIVSLTLALAMLMSVSAFAGFADSAEINKDCVASVNLLTAVNIINGIKNEDGTTSFNPNGTIKRAEAAKMIYVLRNGGVDDKAETWKSAISFTDCKDHWAAGYIAYCEVYGIISGRSETVFDPEAPVTGIELAKMLLTVAGYKASVEGYTGAGWEKNVVEDANEAGLFEACKFALSEPAPRQWAAKMFTNAFDAQLPIYIGDFRVDAGIGSGATVAQKYLNLASATDVVIATKTAALNTTKVTADGMKTKLQTKGDVKFAVSDALIGQQVTVAWNDVNADGAIGSSETIYGITATGKTISGELKVAKALTSGTDKGKYPVTVGGVSMGNKAGTVEIGLDEATIADVYTEVTNAKTTAYALVAYDFNGDKTIDATSGTVAQYGKVSGLVTSGDNKGDFTVCGISVDVSKTAEFAVEGTMKNGLVAKVTTDGLTGKVTVAPAETAIGVFAGIAGGKYTIGGSQYEISADAIDGGADWLTVANMTKVAQIYTDGKYIVWADEYTTEEVDETPTELTNKLAYVISGAIVVDETSKYDEFGNKLPESEVKNIYKVKVLLASGATAIFEYEQDAKGKILKAADLKVADLFDANGLKADYVGGVYEYSLTSTGTLVLKKALAETKNVDFYNAAGDKLDTLTGSANMGYTVAYNTTKKLFNGTTIMGADSTLVFAKYTNKDGDVEYKIVKLADVKGKDVVTKLVAATDASIGQALLVIASYEYKADEAKTETPYVLATTAAELRVDTDGKVYAFFKAVDLNKAGAAVEYKADKDLYGSVAKGTIYNLTSTDGIITKADSETWETASITAKVADLLIIDGALKETTGNDSAFAKDVKVIVKNGDAYTMGTVASLAVAKKDGESYKDNIKFALNDAGKYAYIIIDVDGDITK